MSDKGRATRKVLVADDDESIRWVLSKAVAAAGFEADFAEDGEKALALLSRHGYAAAFVDVRMPGLEGIEVLERVQARRSPTRFFIMTAVRRPDVAARATRAGAAEFLTKPFDLDRISALLADVAREASSPEAPHREDDIDEWRTASVVGRSAPFLEVFERIGKVADTKATVLLLGERGVGKELVARCIHDLSAPGAPFVAVNVAAVPKDLLESELFGHEKGAFTGADASRDGKLAAAGSGTLFLDEIGDTPPDLQTKLLRALQERDFSRLGSNRSIPFAGRIVAATNRDLRRLVNEGKFRDDLFDRLNVFPIRIPSLSERRDDIPLLADFFLQRYCALLSLPPRAFSKDAVETLASLPWKGNVRQLENFVQRIAVLHTSKLIRKEEVVRELERSESGREGGSATAPLEEMIEERLREFVRKLGDAIDGENSLFDLFMGQMERPLLRTVFEATAGNQLRSAAILGINRNTLRKKLAEAKVGPPGRRKR